MQNPPLTHHIQLEILRRMLKSPEPRFSDLKPTTVESNLFLYHLRQLIKSGLIEKQDKSYALTRAGKIFADRATLATMKIRLQPKILSILCVRRTDEKWLIMKRKHQPFAGYKGFPSGKLHFGETLHEAALRELEEKAGLTGIDLQLRGNLILRFTDEGETINHIIGYVHYAEIPESVNVDKQAEHFETYFGDESELFEEPCFQDHQQLLNYLKRGEFPFIQEDYLNSDY